MPYAGQVLPSPPLGLVLRRSPLVVALVLLHLLL